MERYVDLLEGALKKTESIIRQLLADSADSAWSSYKPGALPQELPLHAFPRPLQLSLCATDQFGKTQSYFLNTANTSGFRGVSTLVTRAGMLTSTVLFDC